MRWRFKCSGLTIGNYIFNLPGWKYRMFRTRFQSFPGIDPSQTEHQVGSQQPWFHLEYLVPYLKSQAKFSI